MNITTIPEVRFRTVDGVRIRYGDELPRLAEVLPRISTSATVISSRNDRVVPHANAEFLHRRLPNSRLVVLDSGQFAWQETPMEYAAIMIRHRRHLHVAVSIPRSLSHPRRNTRVPVRAGPRPSPSKRLH